MGYIYVGIGGVIGSLLRYFTSFISQRYLTSLFPFGTLFVNLVGAFILGWFTTSVIKRGKLSPSLTTAIGTGLIGSFTTLSTLSLESVLMFQQGRFFSLIVYILLSLTGGVLLAFIGFQLGEKNSSVETEE